MTSVLDVERISKTFGGHKALDEVSLSIEPGEIRALVGQNGCGKSTLIKILAGFHDPDGGGSVKVDGQVLDLADTGAGSAAGLRFVHQDLGLVPSLTAVDNIALGKGYAVNQLGLIDWKSETASARASLAELGYDIDVDAPVGSLTISERTAVAIARALTQDSERVRLLVLDEPTANLPAAEAERLYALVRRVAASGVAVLFVSHHFDEVFDLAESATIFRDGRLVTTLPVSGIDESGLIELVIGRTLATAEAQTATEDMGAVVLDAKGISGARVADLDLTVRAGEVVGIAGITGSGRESVAGLLFGAYDRSGVVVVDGVTIAPCRPDKAVEARVALVPAERLSNAAFVEFAVRENVTAVNPRGNVVRGFLRKHKERADVLEWLTRLDVRPLTSENALGTLSGGNQQKVVIARWLRQDPRVLILDEPTQGVDVGSKDDIHRLIEEVAGRGAAVVVASTDHEELVRLCHRVVVLRHGRIVGELSAPGIDSDHITALTIGRSDS